MNRALALAAALSALAVLAGLAAVLGWVLYDDGTYVGDPYDLVMGVVA